MFDQIPFSDVQLTESLVVTFTSSVQLVTNSLHAGQEAIELVVKLLSAIGQFGSVLVLIFEPPQLADDVKTGQQGGGRGDQHVTLDSPLKQGFVVLSRLTLGHAFNSLGTTVAPYLGAILILGSLNAVDTSGLSPAELTSFLSQEASVISNTYASITLFICIVALIVWLKRNELQPSTRPERLNPLAALDLLKQPRFALGTVCIFLYVGAEVTIGSLITDYLMLPTPLALPAEAAGKHVAFYWGGALVGRFIGSALMRTFAPGKLLAFAATAVIVLLTISATTQGVVAGWSLLAVGLFNSIMFPTIFTLATAGLGHRAAEGSGLFCCAIVGGAFIPPLTGYAADLSTLAMALSVPATCYAGIAIYGWYARAPKH